VRVNGHVGVGKGFDPAKWKMEVTGLGDDAHLTLAEIQKLPQTAFTTEFGIEGWATSVGAA
jgi:DMSO/TMAO reductase YedYZ molybdopterin-dependent catalytic subunit